MATPNLPADDGEYLAQVELGANHTALVATVCNDIELTLASDRMGATATLARHDAREVAYRVIEATQKIDEQEDR